MTHRRDRATLLQRVAGVVLVLGLLAGPVGTHVYWMLGGTWGLGRSTTTTGIRIVAVVVVLLLVAAVLVVLARIGLWQQAYVSDGVVRLLSWGLAVFFLFAFYTILCGGLPWYYGEANAVVNERWLPWSSVAWVGWMVCLVLLLRWSSRLSVGQVETPNSLKAELQRR